MCFAFRNRDFSKNRPKDFKKYFVWINRVSLLIPLYFNLY